MTDVRCVGAVIVDDAGRLLLVRRANEPGRGLWSIPGGRVEPGEDDVTALVREVAEETGLAVVVGALLGRVRLPGRVVYDVGDYRCAVLPGSPPARAGSDAAAVRWATFAEVQELDTTDGLVETLAGWGALPAGEGRS